MLAAEISARVLSLYDYAAPEDYLARLGTPTQTHFSRTVSGLDGPTVIEGRTHSFQVRGGVRASFTPEGVAARLSRLFRAETTSGDPAFDDAVFVDTTTAEITGELLRCEPVRRAIAEVVATGGEVQVMDGWVAITVVGDHDGEVLAAGPLAALLAHIEATR